VAADLRRRIAAAEWEVDEALPTTAALAEHYHVSQSTITRVLRNLAAEGLVRTVPRWGTFRT
jgi:DNA-binding GntR family transcriptional regulator